jgi:hypothetical protein
MSGTAFEVTTADLLVVLSDIWFKIEKEEVLEFVLAELDTDKIESVALEAITVLDEDWFDDDEETLSKQTDLAQAEIKVQLLEYIARLIQADFNEIY